MPETRAPRADGRADGWSDPDLEAAADALRRLYGLEFAPSRIASAEDAMRRVMRTLGIASARVLRERATASGEVQDALVGELTIGETYFFREAGQLEFLARELLPVFARERTTPLRLWSAGCSTGEEPYTLAMVLRESAWPHGASVLATDLVPGRLAHAKRGRYGKWSMRGVPEATIARWFHRQGRAFVLDESIREAVEFRVLDLACDDFAAVAGAAAMDVIFCRNVLIYFDPPTVRHVAEQLLASLAPGGWLFLSATDPVLSDIVACEAVPTGAGYAYRRADARGARLLAAQGSSSGGSRLLAAPGSSSDCSRLLSEPGSSSDGSRLLSAPRSSSGGSRPAVVGRAPRTTGVPAWPAEGPRTTGATEPEAARSREPGAAAADSDETSAIAAVRALANRGELDAAGRACAAALDRYPMSARLATLHATLLLQGGRPAEAAAAARRSLYLDRRAPIAHLILGDALARAGDGAGASRAFVNAAELLGALPPEAPVADADGEPAGRLAEMARYRAARSGNVRG